MNKSIDTIMSDTSNILYLVEDSIKTIEIDPEAFTNGSVTERVIERLKANWKSIQDTARKYPDTKFIPEKMRSVLDYAKDNLPKQVYKAIYD